MKRRLASTLAVLALGVSALAVATPAAAQDDGAAYVALGDSVAAGNGIVPYVDETCLRSTRAYPELLAEELGIDVRSAACTEASTTDVLLDQLGDLGPDTELVTVTVGVNNVQLDDDPAPDWGEVLGACSNKSPLPPEFCGILLTAALGVLDPPDGGDGLPEDIVALVEGIRAQAPEAVIYITGYPLLFGDTTKTCNVGGGVSFGVREMVQINEAIEKANALIAEGVAQTGDPDVVFVDVNADVGDAEGFAGHGLCGSGQRWISHLIPSQATTGDRGFHLTAAGHAAFADLLAEEIAG